MKISGKIPLQCHPDTQEIQPYMKYTYEPPWIPQYEPLRPGLNFLRLSGIGGVGGVFLLEVQYSVLKSLISTCVLSYEGSREDWLLDRICESKKDCWDSKRRTSYPYQ